MPKFGKAGRFNGTSSQLSVNTTLNSLMGNTVTETSFSFWVRDTNRISTKILSFFYLEMFNDKFVFNIGLGNTDYLFADTTNGNSKGWRSYEWNHIVVVKSVSDTEVYLNGNLIISLGTGTLSAIANRSITDNRFGFDGVDYTAFDLDHYKEYSRALRQEEVDMLYTESPYIINIANPGFINRLSDLPTSLGDPGFAMYDYKIYTMGGRDFAGNTNNDFNVYDVIQNSITQIDNTTGPNARYGCAMTHHKGKIYFAGGKSGTTYMKDCYFYDFDANDGAGAWEVVSDMIIPLVGGTLVSYEDSIFYFGGIKDDGSFNDSVYVLDPIENTWSTRLTGTQLNRAFLPQFESVYINSAYFLGNTTSGVVKDEVFEYNFLDNTMNKINAGTGEENLDGIQVSLIDNELVVIGGYNINTLSNENRVYGYNIINKTWSAKTTINDTYKQKAGGAVVSFSNALYVLGGYNNDRNPTNSVFVYFR